MTDPRRPSPGAQMLTDLLTNHLDPGYAAAARRRAATGGATHARPATRVATAVAAAFVGVVLAVAYGQTVARAPETARTRAALVKDVRARSTQTDSLERSAAALRAAVARQRAALLTGTAAGADEEERLHELEALTGVAKVRGPGVRVVVADGVPKVDPLSGKPIDPAQPERIQDRDLQDLVNGLWVAGAEAVSINGQRLSAVSAIRSAGEAVLVDFRPVSSPYTLAAVGPKTLAVRFGATDAAARFRGYVQKYGMKLDVSTVPDLVLPPASAPELRFAQPLVSASPGPVTSPGPVAGSPGATPVPSHPGGGR